MRRKTISKSLTLAAGLALTAAAWAEAPKDWNVAGGEKDEAMLLKPDLENGLDVYEVCAACHLPEGWGTKEGTFPQLAGQHRNVLIKQMADIRALNRDNPTMYPFALPEAIGDAVLYEPKDVGEEKQIGARLQALRERRAKERKR